MVRQKSTADTRPIWPVQVRDGRLGWGVGGGLVGGKMAGCVGVGDGQEVNKVVE